MNYLYSTGAHLHLKNWELCFDIKMKSIDVFFQRSSFKIYLSYAITVETDHSIRKCHNQNVNMDLSKLQNIDWRSKFTLDTAVSPLRKCNDLAKLILRDVDFKRRLIWLYLRNSKGLTTAFSKRGREHLPLCGAWDLSSTWDPMVEILYFW